MPIYIHHGDTQMIMILNVPTKKKKKNELARRPRKVIVVYTRIHDTPSSRVSVETRNSQWWIKLKQSEEFLRYGNHMIREKSLRVIRKRSSADNQSVAFGTSERAAALNGDHTTILPWYCDKHNRTTNIENIINSSISNNMDTNTQSSTQIKVLNSRKIHSLVVSLNNIYDRRCTLLESELIFLLWIIRRIFGISLFAFYSIDNTIGVRLSVLIETL